MLSLPCLNTNAPHLVRATSTLCKYPPTWVQSLLPIMWWHYYLSTWNPCSLFSGSYIPHHTTHHRPLPLLMDTLSLPHLGSDDQYQDALSCRYHLDLIQALTTCAKMPAIWTPSSSCLALTFHNGTELLLPWPHENIFFPILGYPHT